MRLNRRTSVRLGIALTLMVAGLASADAVPADTCLPGNVVNAKKNCEAGLAACMNGGGDSDTCWNAYWRCIS